MSPQKQAISNKAQVSNQLLNPYLKQRRAVQRPLPVVVSPLKREAVIRSSPRKAREFLSESHKKRESRYDDAGHPNGSLCDKFLRSRSPKVERIPRKKLSTPGVENYRTRAIGKKNTSSDWGDEEMDMIMARVEACERLQISANSSNSHTDSQPSNPFSSHSIATGFERRDVSPWYTMRPPTGLGETDARCVGSLSFLNNTDHGQTKGGYDQLMVDETDMFGPRNSQHPRSHFGSQARPFTTASVTPATRMKLGAPTMATSDNSTRAGASPSTHSREGDNEEEPKFKDVIAQFDRMGWKKL